MENKKKYSAVRIILMVLGIFLISVCVACFRLSGFGVDAFTGMNLGISGFIQWSFGTWQLVANIIILIVVFCIVPHCIGVGTVINMIFVGYVADFICWIFQDIMKVEMLVSYRILFMILGILFASVGVACYMVADMGIAPYDSVAVIIEKVTSGKISFAVARVYSDITALLIGVTFCILAGNSIWNVVGIGTICSALCNGPLIKFFKEQIIRGINQKSL